MREHSARARFACCAAGTHRTSNTPRRRHTPDAQDLTQPAVCACSTTGDEVQRQAGRLRPPRRLDDLALDLTTNTTGGGPCAPLPGCCAGIFRARKAKTAAVGTAAGAARWAFPEANPSPASTCLCTVCRPFNGRQHDGGSPPIQNERPTRLRSSSATHSPGRLAFPTAVCLLACCLFSLI